MLIASPLWENYDECPLNYSYNFTFTAKKKFETMKYEWRGHI